VVRRAWYAEYSGIFSRGEMDAVFAGRLEQHATWAGRRRIALASLVADVDGAVVGVASPALLDGGDGELGAFFVLPEHQGRGVGTALWAATLDVLRGHGCPRMWVWTLARSPRAVGWYSRRGCVDVERGEFRLGGHAEEAVGLVLDLNLDGAV
ncbi:MAG TPA: GNAT family N-acetyltransferase, partial [Candidatus Dormibacteraeota bacterium]|nr:GNAT family N-acetyltransferase [Candidatus Dormibacteraeota bacterium]